MITVLKNIDETRNEAKLSMSCWIKCTFHIYSIERVGDTGVLRTYFISWTYSKILKNIYMKL